MSDRLRACDVEELQEALAAGDCVLVDVRERAELDAEHFPGAVHAPLSAFDRHVHVIDRGRPAYLICASGQRATRAAERLRALGHPDVRVVRGGLRAWVAAGLPVERGSGRVWSLERQVRFVAGALVLSACALAALVHPAFMGLAAFVGGGLVFAGLTDTCGMALLLARMPWNQRAGRSCESR
jgi:rhodanese-related sulfurtransferase